jgi:predicted AlkP superfamily pyrophosphatase or phosphodiesterase
MHGYDPERPEMQASLLWLGPGVKPGPRQGTRLIDVAPTIASWLGLTLAHTDGRVLE